MSELMDGCMDGWMDDKHCCRESNKDEETLEQLDLSSLEDE